MYSCVSLSGSHLCVQEGKLTNGMQPFSLVFIIHWDSEESTVLHSCLSAYEHVHPHHAGFQALFFSVISECWCWDELERLFFLSSQSEVVSSLCYSLRSFMGRRAFEMNAVCSHWTSLKFCFESSQAIMKKSTSNGWRMSCRENLQ